MNMSSKQLQRQLKKPKPSPAAPVQVQVLGLFDVGEIEVTEAAAWALAEAGETGPGPYLIRHAQGGAGWADMDKSAREKARRAAAAKDLTKFPVFTEHRFGASRTQRLWILTQMESGEVYTTVYTTDVTPLLPSNSGATHAHH